MFLFPAMRIEDAVGPGATIEDAVGPGDENLYLSRSALSSKIASHAPHLP